jgi:GrpB-like predicted nucleotidyltransferase (UPF0157 family)
MALIEIIPYQPRWSGEFQELARPIRAALGRLALRIDHIGSTSVPGLIAKDIIDMQVTVVTLAPEVEAALASVGYERKVEIGSDHVPPGDLTDPEQWTKWIFLPRAGRRTHLHVRIAGRANQRYPLLFRDYLRADPVAREAYGQVKTALARLHPDDKDAYYAVKDPVCDIIVVAAEAWAAARGWAPGPSDA